jgi:integrase/recombinase XerD
MPKPALPKNCYWRGEIIWARFKVAGVEYRESLRTRSVALAERRLKAAREAVEQQVFFGDREKVSWMAAVVSWSLLGHRAQGIKESTFDRYTVSLGQLRPWLDAKDLHEIDVKALKGIVQDRQRAGATNATIRRDMTAVSSVLAHAVDKDWLEENPAKTLDRSRFRERRQKIILPRPDSLAQVTAIGSRFIDMAALAVETGMREEEIASLTHDRIDRQRAVAVLEETKGGTVRQVPLSPLAIEIIGRQPRFLKSPWVFWRADGQRFKNVAAQFYATVGRVAQKAAQQGGEFKRFRFHDLRHLFAVTFLRERRGTIYDLQQVMGHASIKTTEGYLDHLTPDERRDAIQGVAQIAAQDDRFAGGADA